MNGVSTYSETKQNDLKTRYIKCQKNCYIYNNIEEKNEIVA